MSAFPINIQSDLSILFFSSEDREKSCYKVVCCESFSWSGPEHVGEEIGYKEGEELGICLIKKGKLARSNPEKTGIEVKFKKIMREVALPLRLQTYFKGFLNVIPLISRIPFQ